MLATFWDSNSTVNRHGNRLKSLISLCGLWLAEGLNAWDPPLLPSQPQPRRFRGVEIARPPTSWVAFGQCENTSVRKLLEVRGQVTKRVEVFTYDFSIVIKILWKIDYVAIYFLAITSLQRFAHATTAQLLCHVKNIVTTTLLEFRWEQNKFPSNLNSVGNIFSETVLGHKKGDKMWPKGTSHTSVLNQ